MDINADLLEIFGNLAFYIQLRKFSLDVDIKLSLNPWLQLQLKDKKKKIKISE